MIQLTFDIDAFIVSDRLASKFSSSSTSWRTGANQREVRQLQKEIDKALKESLDGLRRVDKKGRADKFLFAYLRRKNTVVNIKKMPK
ncbi:hypothetical protein [Paenibacillus polymyxa]|uniref:hypothetical protein n=1 Tax=Paenibacillus polymyxa TaxID=1406 RepID=UPI0020240284|nr:hypothetical protein [Paenibacillus polymyxa]URJ59062.1 hypothetical protein MF622_003666 [Paenibacillus polymyxa]